FRAEGLLRHFAARRLPLAAEELRSGDQHAKLSAVEIRCRLSVVATYAVTIPKRQPTTDNRHPRNKEQRTMRRPLFLTLALATLAITALAAASPRDALVVDAAWLQGHVKDPDLVLL